MNASTTMDQERALLQHMLAAIAYRTQKALRDAPERYPNFSAGHQARTPLEVLRHMTSVLGYCRTFFVGGSYPVKPEPLATFADEIVRFHEVAQDVGRHLAAGTPLREISNRQLLQGPVEGTYLLTGAGAIWAANLLTFSLWYWEIDGGGPSERSRDGHVSSDFLFPQLQIGDGTSSGGWWPGFLDYMFVAFNASTAFSPTDTLLLTRRAKVLMMIQSLISGVTVIVIAARAINTLG